MAAKIIESKISLVVSDQDTKPGLFIDPSGGNVIAHLTKGFNSGSFPKDQDNALRAGAHVPLQGGQDGTEFGFVQIGRANFYGAFYAGRIRREGGVSVQAHLPPALPQNVMLDAVGTPPMPFFENPQNSSFTAPTINSSWGDHPASKIPAKISNSARSNVDNFLFHFIDDREFWTIFTAQDTGGALRYLAHFHWQIRYEFKFKWVNEKPVLDVSKSFFKMHERNGRGRPADPEIQGMLNTPAEPRANVAFGKAILLAFKGPRGPNRSESEERFNNVPDNFWT